MKKILFATTALVATAGVAAAEVSFSGYGRFGVADFDTAAGASIYTRIRLQIDMSTEADNGITFGARLRYQATSFDGAGTINNFNAARFHAKAGGFELGVGNIQGAWEWMPGVYANSQSASVGLSGLGFHDTLGSNANVPGGWAWDAYSSGGAGAASANGVEVKYSAGSFGGHLSYSDTGAVGGESIAAHVSYAFGDWTVAAGMVDNGAARGADMAGLTVSGKLGPASVTLGYADISGVGDQIVLRGSFEVGAATTVDAYVTSVTAGEAFGLGLSHSLGGGASLEAGYSSNNAISSDQWDLGVRFNF